LGGLTLVEPVLAVAVAVMVMVMEMEVELALVGSWLLAF